MERTFEIATRISGNTKGYVMDENGVTVWKMKGNKRSTENSIMATIKRICNMSGIKIEDVISFKETTK